MPISKPSLVALSVFSLAACGGDPKPTPHAPTPPASSAAVALVPTASASSPGPTPPDAPKSRFQLFADMGAEGQIAGLGDKGLLLMSPNILSVEGDTVLADAKWLAGIDGLGSNVTWESPALQGAFGLFPGDVWMNAIIPSGRTAATLTYKWKGDRWGREESAENERLASSFDIQGQRYGIFTGWMSFSVSVRPMKRGGKQVAMPGGGCKEGKLMPQTGLSLPGGTVLFVGDTCDESSAPKTTSAMHWDPSKKTAVVQALPGVRADERLEWGDGQSARLFATGDGGAELWVSFDKRTYSARFDGTKWTEQPAPPGSTFGHQMTPDGTVWMISGGSLLRKPKGGTAEALALPDPTWKASSFWAKSETDIWVVAGSILLHTAPNPKPGTFPALEKQAAASKALATPKALTSACQTPFVFLFAPTKMAPADFDYPLTRKALVGHKEFGEAVFVEWKVGEKRFFGAKVPSGEMAKRLTALITKELAGSSPQAVCHDPEPTRTLKIDLATGNVVK